MSKLQPTGRAIGIIGLVIIVVAIFLVSVGLGGTSLAGLEGGQQVGYGTAAFIWSAFFLSVIAVTAFSFHAALRWREQRGLKPIPNMKRAVLISIAAIAAAIVVVQFGTSSLAGFEAGIRAGYAPLALTWIAAGLTLGVNAVLLAEAYLGKEPVQVPPPAALPPAVIATDGMVPASVVVGPASAAPSASAKPGISPADIKRVEMILGDPQDMAMLTAEVPSRERVLYSRDDIQTRNNIAQWIMSSMSADAAISKAKLEARFEEQFPQVLWPLFNSVVYDMIYRNKLVSKKEGGKMMLEIPHEEAESGSSR